MVIAQQVRFFNKWVIHEGMIKIAGWPRGPISIVRYTGRRGGKNFATPVISVPLEDGFVFALASGPRADWYRSVLAAGHCQVCWHGQECTLERPEPVAVGEALKAFPQPFRLILKTMKLRDFVRMRFAPVEPIRYRN